MTPEPAGGRRPGPGALASAGQANCYGAVRTDPFPNPAPGTVELGVALARSGPVTIRIVDLAGRVRRRLLADELPAGRHALTWDGRDQDGHRLGRGVYYVAVSGLGEEAAARVALIGEGGK